MSGGQEEASLTFISATNICYDSCLQLAKLTRSSLRAREEELRRSKSNLNWKLVALPRQLAWPIAPTVSI